jgi:hypothetical protein
MAFTANLVWEIRTTGNDNNGGGYATGSTGTDFTQQDSAQYSLSNGVTNGSATVSTVSATADMVGNVCRITGGTGAVATKWYQILSAVVGTSITVDTATGLTTGTGVSITVGGALAGIGGFGAASTTGSATTWIVYIKAGTYSITSATSNISGGTSNATGRFVGYSTNRTLTNTDTSPVIQVNVASCTLLTSTGFSSGQMCYNITFDGNSQTSSTLSSSSGNPMFYLCLLKNFTAANLANNPVFMYCKATGNGAQIFRGSCFACEAYANTATPYNNNANVNVDCLSYNNTGGSTDGFGVGGWGSFVNCVSYGNGRHGFNAAPLYAFNCIAEANVGSGFTCGAGTSHYISCATYNNAAGFTSTATNPAVQIGSVLGTTGSFFIAPGSNDFRLNNLAGRGALLRNAGYPTTFQNASATKVYRDIGAGQSRVPWQNFGMEG